MSMEGGAMVPGRLLFLLHQKWNHSERVGPRENVISKGLVVGLFVNVKVHRSKPVSLGMGGTSPRYRFGRCNVKVTIVRPM